MRTVLITVECTTMQGEQRRFRFGIVEQLGIGKLYLDVTDGLGII